MPIVNVTMWESDNNDLKHSIMKRIAKAIQEETGVRADKITVYITEIPNYNWSDAGVIGSNPDFLELSSRHRIDD